jgi:DNA polymerase-3 subunit delta
MIIFLYGPDTFRARQKLTEIVEHYKKTNKSGFNLRYFTADSDNLEELLDWLKTKPMFSEKKLVILKNAAKFLSHFKNFVKSEHILLFFEEGGSLPKLPGVKTQKFEFLSWLKLREWVKKEFLKLGLKPDADVIEKLVSFVGSDSWRIHNEIIKLASYAKQKNVSAKDVELLVRQKIETDIFKTVRALAFKNKKQSLILIHQHLEKGDHPLYLLTMIAWQFRQLLSQKRSTLFTQQELKKIYRKILEVDINIKIGKIEPEVALDLLITEI